MKRIAWIAVVASAGLIAGLRAVGPVSVAKLVPAALVGDEPVPALIPRAVIVGNPARSDVRISPDGTQLAWLAPRDGVMNVWVAPVGDLEQARPVTADTRRPIRQYGWAYTGRHLLYVQDAAGDENFHVFRADLADGTVVDLTPYRGARAELVAMSPRQPTAVMIAINDRDPRVFDLYRVDLVSAARTLVARNTGGFSGFAVDNALAVRFASKMLPDGSYQLLVPETPRADTTWKLFDTVPFDDAGASHLVAFAPSNDAVYVTDSRGRDTAALVSIDLATRKATVIAEDARADTNAVMFHPTRRTLQAVGFDYLKPSWQVLDPSIRDDLDHLARLDGGVPRVESRTLDDRTWIVATISAHCPARYYLWDRASQHARFLFAKRPELEGQPTVEMTPVEIPSRDGLTLVSYLSRPVAHGPQPMVLLVHGGPWARDHWGYSGLHQLLANRGYAVLSVNFRGSRGFGKKFLNAGNLQWGKAMHDDLLDAVAWAVERGITRKDAVCIMGGSYGGYATLVGLAMTPDAFRCGVDLVGPSSLLTLLASIPPYWEPVIHEFHTRMGDPATPEGKAMLIDVSPLTHAARIARPLLIAHGANDPRVKQAESEQIVAAMKAHHLPVTYALFPDEGHGFARPENNLAFLGVVESFLATHLGGRYQPLTRAELDASSMQIKEGAVDIE